MDLFLEGRDGRFVEHKGVCGATPGPLAGDPPFPILRPCRLPMGHPGPHESWVPRRVFDTLVWWSPDTLTVSAKDDQPRRLTVDDDDGPHDEKDSIARR